MDEPTSLDVSGPFEPRYLAFLETITNLRRSLHRYCSRMTGSVLDGEDVVQEALFHAYRKLDTFDDAPPLKPWLFQIAHNRCIDFLRRREVRQEAEAAATPRRRTSLTLRSLLALSSTVPSSTWYWLFLPRSARACS
jgi:RNA polymerase sigma-70 factor, ECF subfamily